MVYEIYTTCFDQSDHSNVISNSIPRSFYVVPLSLSGARSSYIDACVTGFTVVSPITAAVQKKLNRVLLSRDQMDFLISQLCIDRMYYYRGMQKCMTLSYSNVLL